MKSSSYAKPGIGHRNRLPQRCGRQGTRESTVGPGQLPAHQWPRAARPPPPYISLSLEWPIISLQLKRQWSLLQQPECSQALGSESQHRSRGDWNGDFTVILPFTTPEGAVRIAFVISRGVLSPFGKEFPLYLLHWTLGGNTDEKLWNLHQMLLNGAERRLSSYSLRVNSFLPNSCLLNCEMWYVLNSS